MQSNEVETIEGFDIPKRQLTDEEKTREITLERFNDFHGEAGEDFCDQVSIGNFRVFGGFILHKYPDKAKKILDLCNKTDGDIHMFQRIYDDLDQFYTDYAEMINLTVISKERVNQILIQIEEYYGKS